MNARPGVSGVGRLQRIALIGFGEAGSILGADLVSAGCDVSTYDILLNDAKTRPTCSLAQSAHTCVPADTFAAAVVGAELIISAVTASSSGDVAALAGKHLGTGQIFLDINSVSPAQEAIELQRGGILRRALRRGRRHGTRAAVSTESADAARRPDARKRSRRSSTRFGMKTTAIANEIGIASAVKMCRSVVIKGIESLALESMLAARHFGAEEQVLASLNQTFPGMGWEKELPDYLISRVAEHGRRRAAEMREVASTLRDAGFEPTMASAIAERQDAAHRRDDRQRASALDGEANSPGERSRTN